MTDDHENKIQHHVQNARRYQNVQRLARVACRTEHRIAEVVQRRRRQTKAVNLQIANRTLNEDILRAQQRQQRTRTKKARRQRDQTHDRR